MNLFRSEEHARRWAQFNPEYERSLQPLSFWSKLFSSRIFKYRARSDYVSWLATEDAKEAIKDLKSQMQ